MIRIGRSLLRQSIKNRVIHTATRFSSTLPAFRTGFVRSSSRFPTRFTQFRSLATLTAMPTTSRVAPPVPAPNFVFTAGQITTIIERTIDQSQTLLDRIAALPLADCTFDNTFRSLALRDYEESLEAEVAIFQQFVNTQADIRDAAVEGDKTIQEFGLNSVTRMDIYERLIAARKNTPIESLNPEEIRLMNRMILDRERVGLSLSAEKREELLEIKKRIMRLSTDFQRHCNEENGFLLFTESELEGVPADVISGFEKDGDKFKVTFKTPDIIPVFKYASNPNTRRLATIGYENKTLATNRPLLAEIISLKREAAALLGMENWADHILQVKMAKNSENVHTFLSDLQTKILPIGEAEKVKLLSIKKAEYAERGLEYDGKLNMWDSNYYSRISLERSLNLDHEMIKSYFPVSNVVPAILKIYSRLLNLSFDLVERTKEAGGITWHDDADMYAVWDNSNPETRENFLGYLCLDLFPRENKYGHAAVWGLIPSCLNADGKSRNYATVAMVANLAKSTPDRPALMKHGDVVTFFHELGHAFHQLCSVTQFAKFSGTHVARDFVEAPSQMLENWCWDPVVLKEMSEHYETKESLSDEDIDKLVKSKSVNQGLFNLRQLFHGIFDMRVHTAKADTDLTKLWCDLREEVTLCSVGGEEMGGHSGFAHIVGGYDAGYYGYLYSQAFSADMYKTVFANDPMSVTNGAKYRNEILRVGGSRDEMESLVAFLGREPNNVAFMESLGEEVPAKL